MTPSSFGCLSSVFFIQTCIIILTVVAFLSHLSIRLHINGKYMDNLNNNPIKMFLLKDNSPGKVIVLSHLKMALLDNTNLSAKWQEYFKFLIYESH